MLTNFFIYIGLYALICYLYDNLKSPVLLLWHAYKEKCNGQLPLNLKERYGEWAVITGSTDGIGKGYARALAAKGLNIVLISRTESKLESVAAEIEREFKVQTKIIVADFTDGEPIYDHIEKELDNLPVGIVVNNVGANVSRPGLLSSFTNKELWNVIYTNVAPVTILSRFFIHRMKKSNVKGLIINISSGTELQPLPFASLYAASKAFNRSLTVALHHEARFLGIEVQLVSPNFVVTNINKWSKWIMRGGLFVPDYNTYATWAVNTIGKTDVTTGYPLHGLQTAFFKVFPFRVRTFPVILVAKLLHSMEKRRS